MKQFDANRVWERVQSPPLPDTQAMDPLMELLVLQIRICQHLTRKLPLPQAAVARELHRQYQQQLLCLKGMQVLLSGTVSRISPVPVPADPPDLLLRQAYARALRLRTEYEARRGDPAYGHIFRLLSNQVPEQSCRILELLGMSLQS